MCARPKTLIPENTLFETAAETAKEHAWQVTTSDML